MQLVCSRNLTGMVADSVSFSYLRAAEQGHATAQRELGGCFQSGACWDVDERKAVLWYRKAAEGGDSEALYRFCTLILRVPNSLRACHSLGDCLFNGRGVEQNEAGAVELWKQAAARGSRALQSHSCQFVVQATCVSELATRWHTRSKQASGWRKTAKQRCCGSGAKTKTSTPFAIAAISAESSGK